MRKGKNMFSQDYMIEKRISSLMIGVYGWMSCALTVTALTAYGVALHPPLFFYVQQSGILFGLVLMQVAFVIGLSLFLNRISYATALIMFLLYALSLGVTLSVIFYVYTQASIISAFLSTALMFGVMSFYGYVTRTDLTHIGNISIMALCGIFIAMLVNIFLRSAAFDYIISVIGIIVFVLLTAYDTQKIKSFSRSMIMHEEIKNKIALIGALMLYLDFINLFLFILRVFGNKRNE